MPWARRLQHGLRRIVPSRSIGGVFLQPRSGFTLIELLVTIGVVGMLIGVSVPAMSLVRARARKVECVSNLRQIGLLFQEYLDMPKHALKFPDACRLPSVNPRKLPPIFVFLDSAHKSVKSTTRNASGEEETRTVIYSNVQELFRCPADDEYFSAEGLSYEYFSTYANRTLKDALTSRRSRDKLNPAYVSIMTEFGPFHGSEVSVHGDSSPHSKNRHYLYLDWHVDDGADEVANLARSGDQDPNNKDAGPAPEGTNPPAPTTNPAPTNY